MNSSFALSDIPPPDPEPTAPEPPPEAPPMEPAPPFPGQDPEPAFVPEQPQETPPEFGLPDGDLTRF